MVRSARTLWGVVREDTMGDRVRVVVLLASGPAASRN